MEERVCSSEEGDCGCTIGNRFLKEAEPPVSYFSILPDTPAFRAEIVWESGIVSLVASLFVFCTKNNFSRQNNGLSSEMN